MIHAKAGFLELRLGPDFSPRQQWSSRRVPDLRSGSPTSTRTQHRSILAHFRPILTYCPVAEASSSRFHLWDPRAHRRDFSTVTGDFDPTVRPTMSKPNYTGLYHLISQENMEQYLAGLGKMVTFLARLHFTPPLFLVDPYFEGLFLFATNFTAKASLQTHFRAVAKRIISMSRTSPCPLHNPRKLVHARARPLCKCMAALLTAL